MWGRSFSRLTSVQLSYDCILYFSKHKQKKTVSYAVYTYNWYNMAIGYYSLWLYVLDIRNEDKLHDNYMQQCFDFYLQNLASCPYKSKSAPSLQSQWKIYCGSSIKGRKGSFATFPVLLNVDWLIKIKRQ